MEKNFHDLSWMFFQMGLAIVTVSMMIGSFSGRAKIYVVVIFLILHHLFVFIPIAHWVWGSGGWLKKIGFIDYAGGAVSHLTSGVSSFVVCLLIGKRLFIKKEELFKHNIPLQQ